MTTPTARVAVVHRQTRRTLTLAAAFALAAALTIVVPHDTGAWLPLHLLLAGSLLLAISGATRLFVVTWSAAEPHGDRVVAVQRWLLAAGAAAVAVSRELDLAPWTIVAAGGSVVAALALLAVLLAAEQRRARVDRFAAASRYYLTAIAFGVAGTTLGILTATGRASARDEHVALNVLGLAGLVIAGTLPTFLATQARTKVSARATPARLHVVLAALATGVVAAAWGSAGDRDLALRIGLLLYAAALAHLVTLLPAIGPKQLRWAGPRLVQLLVGCAWWIVAVAAGAWTGGLSREVVLAIVVGGYVQILLASLAYLAPVLRAGGHERLARGFRTTRSWASVLTINVAAGALVIDHGAIAGVALLVAAVDAAARAARLARRGSRAEM